MHRAALIARVVGATLTAVAIGAIGGVASVGAATSGTPAALVPSVSPGRQPSDAAPVSSWLAWAAAQRQDIESTPWAQELAAQGDRLIDVQYVTVSTVWGVDAPAGMPTAAAVVTYVDTSPATRPLDDAEPATSLAAPLADGGRCGSITDGTACIESTAEAGGYSVAASYTYAAGGRIEGHVEMTTDGCPGSAVKNGVNQSFTDGVTQEVVYGPVSGTAEWASTFWLDSAGRYTDWGTTCADL